MRYKEIIEKMSLEEKAAILSGKDAWSTREIKRLGINSINCSDGPHGIRKQVGEGDHLGINASLKATCFPTAATVGNSWNEELAIKVGEALGEEARAMDVDILLGPGLNIKRSPLCGRNFEYFSEDPYLAGKMTAAYVKGIQEKGVHSCIKHFAVNSREERRMCTDSIVDERTLREIYLTAFEIGVKEADAKAIMSSYNMINGTYANENKYLLDDILRKEWGFDGIVITDWGASNSHIQGSIAGSNLEMPNPGLDSARELVKAVKKGELAESILDERVDELLYIIDKVKGIGTRVDTSIKEFDKEAHHELARQAASESIVLLKNNNKILPILNKTKVAVIGEFAFEQRYQGAGSSIVNATKVDTIIDCIKSYKDLELVGSARGYERVDKKNDILLKEALEITKDAEIILLCFGLDEISESEGLDRQDINLPKNQVRLISSLYKNLKKGQKLVGILSAGSVVDLSIADKFEALIHTYLAGQAGASASLDVISGKVNPSGKLAETYPFSYSDTPAYKYYLTNSKNAEYREGIFVGYRYYEKVDKKVAYPFGYGLSYTEFKYSNLEVNDTYVEFELENIGDFAGSEVVQLYIGNKDSNIIRANKELKAFKKVYLNVGEKKKVRLEFDDKTFRYFEQAKRKWQVEEGKYEVYIGSSSQDIRLEGSIYKAGYKSDTYENDIFANYKKGRVTNISDKEFEALLGRKLMLEKRTRKLEINDPLSYMKHSKSFVTRFIYKQLEKALEKSKKKGKPDINILFLYNMPFRALAKMSSGKISMDMAKDIVDICNGKGFLAYTSFIKGYIKNKKENKKYEEILKF